MGNFTEYDANNPESAWMRNFNRVQGALQTGESPAAVVAALQAEGWPEEEAQRIVEAQNAPPVQSADPQESAKLSSQRSGSGRRRSHGHLPRDQSWGCVQGVCIFWLISGFFLILAFLVTFIQEDTGSEGNLVGLQIFFGVIGSAYVIIAIGLLRLQAWARVPALVLGGLMCLSIPIGTIIGILFLSAMSKNQHVFRSRGR